MSLHVPCARCRYDLFGNSAAGACPECGGAIRVSIHSRRPLFMTELQLAVLIWATILPIGAPILLALSFALSLGGMLDHPGPSRVFGMAWLTLWYSCLVSVIGVSALTATNGRGWLERAGGLALGGSGVGIALTPAVAPIEYSAPVAWLLTLLGLYVAIVAGSLWHAPSRPGALVFIAAWLVSCTVWLFIPTVMGWSAFIPCYVASGASIIVGSLVASAVLFRERRDQRRMLKLDLEARETCA
ncbi:MAG: hypothetical protein U1D55_11890 [Phycisphaerae bacterium]